MSRSVPPPPPPPPPPPSSLPPPPPVPSDNAGAPPKRAWWKRKRVLIPAGLIAVVLIATATNQNGTDPQATGTTPSSSAASPRESAAEPTTESAAQPTTEEEATPTPEAPSYAGDYDGAFGTFAVLKKSGSGDSVVKLPAGLMGGVLTATHRGSSNFTIQSLDSSNQDVDLLVNDIGRYSGTTFIAEGMTGETPTKLKIEADGRWTITVKPVAQAAKFQNKNAGKGDMVLLYEMPASDVRFTHSGEGNFAIKSEGNGDGLLVNEIGKYSGVVPVTDGPSVIIITADGSWTAQRQ